MRTAGISIIRIDGEDVNSVGPLPGKQRTETAHRARGNAVKHFFVAFSAFISKSLLPTLGQRFEAFFGVPKQQKLDGPEGGYCRCRESMRFGPIRACAG